MKVGLPLIICVLKPLAKNILTLLGLTAAASEQTHKLIKKFIVLGTTTTKIFPTK